MAHSELFILLPRYEDSVGQPDYIQSREVMSEEEILDIIGRIDQMCRVLTNENHRGFYDARNITAFLYPVDTMEEFYPDIRTRMRLVMNKWGENWRSQMMQKDTKCYTYHHCPISDDTLCEMTERKHLATDGSTFLLVNCDAMACPAESIRTSHDRNEVELDVATSDITVILKWYETNRRPQRLFNLNPKHGENGKRAHADNKGDKVSVLLCSREEAAAMLSKAVGPDLKVLYYLDKKHRRYIEFRRERENTYHGFHLDEEDCNRVPLETKSMIDQLP